MIDIATFVMGVLLVYMIVKPMINANKIKQLERKNE